LAIIVSLGSQLETFSSINIHKIGHEHNHHKLGSVESWLKHYTR